MAPDIDHRGARERLSPYVRKTPLVRSDWLSDAAGRPVFLKCENLQVTGSFKARGAVNRLLTLGAEERRRGVVTASAGNHGQAVAWAARRLGIDATIVLPEDSVAAKVTQTQRWGADVVLAGHGYDEAHLIAEERAHRTGARYIAAFDDLDVIAGAGTVAAEIVDELPEVALIVTPVGGGGLVAGVASLAAERTDKHRDPPGTAGAQSVHPYPARGGRQDASGPGDAPRPSHSSLVFGVQSTRTSAMHDALAAGRLVPASSPPTLADGLSGATCATTFDLCRALEVEVMLVDEDLLLPAIGATALREHLVIEGSAAVSVAAITAGLIPAGDAPVALILSGGNLDPAVLARAVELT